MTPKEDVEDIQLSEFVTLRGVPTHIVKYGHINRDDTHPNHNVLVLIIPGNPGIIEYYEEYMEYLYHLGDCQIPVWGVSHAGHVRIPDHIPQQEPVGDPFCLAGQVQHKIDFIRSQVPADTKIIFVSHSIGCYMVLEIMKQMPELHIIKAIQLFPTIERMAESPHGKIATPLLQYLRWLAIIVITLLSYLSPVVQYRMVRWFFQNRPVATCSYNASLNLFDPFAAGNSMYMAWTEMTQVIEPDLKTISDNLSKLIFYYGVVDHWCPKEYYETMKSTFPHGHIYLCKEGFEHAFVLESSIPMADITMNWIKEILNKSKD